MRFVVDARVYYRTLPAYRPPRDILGGRKYKFRDGGPRRHFGVVEENKLFVYRVNYEFEMLSHNNIVSAVGSQ